MNPDFRIPLATIISRTDHPQQNTIHPNIRIHQKESRNVMSGRDRTDNNNTPNP